MSSVVVQVEKLSKRYRLGVIGAKRLKDDVNRWLTRLRGRECPLEKVGCKDGKNTANGTFWALKDVSFEVKQGEVIGVIGRNGAGKSTLLKILSQVTAPTTGEVRIKGRVASLLEVGTGFQPDLSGRDNVYLNGSILGMTKAEIRRKFDEIVAFSEVEKFIDTPVKRYSSGMFVRLAFAVAAHLEPEILIIDEVLAVGDAAFQRKCLGKMNQVSTQEGRTILFVSHNMIAVQSLCNRAVMLDHGQLKGDGPTSEMLSVYMEDCDRGSGQSSWNTVGEAPGNEILRFKRVAVVRRDVESNGVISMQDPIAVQTDYWILQPGKTLHITYHLINSAGITVLTTGSPTSVSQPGLHRAAFCIPGGLLNSGHYSLRALVVENHNRVIYQKDNIAAFSVVDLAERQHAYLGREPGVVQPVLHWSSERLPELSLSL
jgi:lipopolysaccharide transport system ATP-binding protein